MMLRRMVIAGTLTLACAAPAVAAAAAVSTYRSGIYRGTLRGGGHITLTVVGAFVTRIRVSGHWTCSDGVTPISYAYTVRDKARHRPRINRAGTFKVGDLTFASPETQNNDGTVAANTSLSGTFKGSKVSGHFAVNGEASNSFQCDGGGAFKATRNG